MPHVDKISALTLRIFLHADGSRFLENTVGTENHPL